LLQKNTFWSAGGSLVPQSDHYILPNIFRLLQRLGKIKNLPEQFVCQWQYSFDEIITF